MRLLLAILVVALAGQAEARSYRGHLYVGPENEAFYPCGSKVGYWFVASPSVRGRLMSEGLAKSDSLSEQGVFVELDGDVGRATVESDGMASAYPAYFHIERLVVIRQVSADDCQR